MQKIEMINKLKDMGLQLMPLQPFSKEPFAGANWTRLQTEKYTGEFPDSCNVAVICGEISGKVFVVDLDTESLWNEFNEYHDKTFIVKTARGHHLYFHYNGIPPPNRKFDDWRGRHIDIKSEGGYVLSPPSIHPDTKKEYEILSDKPILIIDISIIKEKLKQLGFDVEKKSLEDIAKGVTEGGRNDSTFKYACYLIRDKGLYGEALRKEIDELNSRHKPPLSKSELEMILASAMKYESDSIVKSPEIISLEKLDELIESGNFTDVSLRPYVRVLTEEIVNAKIEKATGKKFNLVKRIKVQDINPTEHEGILIEFDAMIVAVDERKTFTKWAQFECEKCGNVKELSCDEFYKIEIPFCGKDKRPYTINHDTKQTDYVQAIYIEEFLEEAKNNSPISFDVEIIGKHVGEAFTSDRKTFVAKLRSIQDKTGYNHIVFQVFEMRDIEQKQGCLPSPEELAKWKANSVIYENVLRSIAPELKINPLIKESCMLAITGGTSINEKRDKIHIDLIGDAQTGKSELLKSLNKMTPGSGMAIGGKVSGPGLTIGMVKLHNGTMVPRAGLLCKYTGNIVYYDEIDKSKPDDWNSVLECMEQQTATMTKAGFPNVRLPAATTIIGAGNPKGGKYNPNYPSVMDNFVMSPSFISRFDITWLMLDQNDPEMDELIMRHIQDYKNNKDKYMQVEELQRFFSYVRTLRPKVPASLDEKINELYRKIRPLNKLQGLPIGLRQYYGLYRLITASAACHLREEANEYDIMIVQNILRESLKSMGMNMDTGKLEKVIQRQVVAKEQVFLETWNNLMDDDGTVNREEFIETLATKEPFNSHNSSVEFEKWHESGQLQLLNENGRYKKVAK